NSIGGLGRARHGKVQVAFLQNRFSKPSRLRHLARDLDLTDRLPLGWQSFMKLRDALCTFELEDQPVRAFRFKKTNIDAIVLPELCRPYTSEHHGGQDRLPRDVEMSVFRDCRGPQ